MSTSSPAFTDTEIERHRPALVGYCYRMLGSPFEAEDAVQDTMLRAWRSRERFEGRSSVKSWLYSIATNVCLDQLKGRKRRATPMDLGPARAAELANLNLRPDEEWIEPIPDSLVAPDPDPAEAAVRGESLRLAFVAALQRLPARQRAALILCEALHWSAAEAAELLDSSVASINSVLQRARATLADSAGAEDARVSDLGADEQALLARYVDAFERYDMEVLQSLIHEDASQSMPPYDLWLAGRDDILKWWVGPGGGCRGSRVIPTISANGSPAFAQYKPSASGEGYEPWALQVLELRDGGIGRFTFFLNVQTLFPLFGLPLTFEG
ncbi:MAG: sigma-70 family RNA polymerase sigma factor [Solirubrobacteraceae bacterium]